MSSKASLIRTTTARSRVKIRIVTDYYPDKASRLPVMLFNPDPARRIDVQVFVHKPRSADSDVKCDLHPRWSRDERMLAVDTCEAGFRQVRILDVNDLVN